MKSLISFSFLRAVSAAMFVAPLFTFSVNAQADLASLIGKDVTIINTGSNKALTVPGSSSENGTTLIQYEYLEGAANQHWRIESVGTDLYRIVNINSGKVLEIADQGTEDGDLARQWDYFDVAHHHWQLTELSANIFQIINDNSGKALEIEDGSSANGAAVRQWSYVDVAHHQWAISEVSAPSSSGGGSSVLQAENASAIAGGGVESDTNAEGGQFFDFKQDGKLTFDINVPAAQKYTITFRYRSPYGDKTQNIRVNQGASTPVNFTEQSDWTTLSLDYDLNAGSNSFEIEASWGWSHLDQISFAPVGGNSDDNSDNNNDDSNSNNGTLIFEAESASLAGAVVAKSDASASDGGYAEMAAAGSVAASTNINVAGTYELRVAYQSLYGDKKQNIVIADKFHETLPFYQATEWTEVSTLVSLEIGQQDIKVEAGWGWINIDYISLRFVGPDAAGCYNNGNVNHLGDSDKDGIPDCAEQINVSYAGEQFYELGARVGVRDLFVEIDWMESSDLGIIPQKEALEKVRIAFAKEGFGIHFDVGNLYSTSTGIDRENFNLGGGNALPFTTRLTLGYSLGSNTIGVPNLKTDHMAENRKTGPFYYMVFGNTQNVDGTRGSSGRAWINDLANIYLPHSIITMGGWGLDRDDEESTNILINYQAGTIMHEFGHNLGLRHGGHEDTNRKPNYLSVMSYDYQLDGLPIRGTREGDRLMRRMGTTLRNNGCDKSLLNGPKQSFENFVIDFSHGALPELNEHELHEQDGFRDLGSSPIDFNCNGSTNEVLTQLDINADGVFGTLEDHDDWGNIVMFFYHKSLNSGNSLSGYGEMSVESAPGEALFRELDSLNK